MIRLNDGCFGRLRSGQVVGPFRALDNGGPYAYRAIGQGWTDDGRFVAGATEPHALDVVEICKGPRHV